MSNDESDPDGAHKLEGTGNTDDSSAAASRSGGPAESLPKRRLIHYLPGLAVIFGVSAIPLIEVYGGAPGSDMDGLLYAMSLPFVATGYIVFTVRRVFPGILRKFVLFGAIPTYLLSAGIVTTLAVNMPMALHLRMAEEQLRPLAERVNKVRASVGHPPESLCESLVGIGEKRPDCLAYYGIHYWHDAENFAIIAVRQGRFTSPSSMYSSISGQWSSRLLGEIIDYDGLTEGLPVGFKHWLQAPWPGYSYEGSGKWRCRED